MDHAPVTVWILGDQLLRSHPALAAAEAAAGREQVRVVLVESEARVAQLPYQRKKIALLLSAMRHYAAALRAQGYPVDDVRAPTFAEGLRRHTEQHQPRRLVTMAAAEYETRRFQQTTLGDLLDIPVDVLPNTQFLTGQYDPFPGNGQPPRRVVMERFYRAMRRHTGILLEPGGSPAGGAWNFDALNRRPLPRAVIPPPPMSFAPDALTAQVIAEVDARGGGVGAAAGFALAVTHEQAQAALDDFITHRLAAFGPYEDAMSATHDVLFHSALSPYLNIGLLEPLQVARAAEAAYRSGQVPIQSAEGFVRQVIGWREYIYWQYWRLMPGLRHANAWNAQRALPAFFWNGDTDLHCLHRVIERAITTGYTHHIERLMIICNFCLLAGIRPADVNDWFLAHYIDAYDWVMQPNVIGMGLNADGGLTATKPYIASAAYINRMSDYCAGCRYDPRQRSGPDACPFNLLYWSFLIRHEATLRANPRLGPAVLGLARLGTAERETILQQAAQWLETPGARGEKDQR
ncbi:MAG: cryptochrome/photolyase family protein [Chloroflexi bacterium]|nr:cryptochrome/photolyase family protein [Chloroflexota bacterium]